MNGDLISRNALKEIVACYGATEDFDSLIDQIPAIDAEPVQYGRWEVDMRMNYKAYPPYEYKRGYKCSLCGRSERTNKEPYCHCGAKMDLEKLCL